MSKFMRKGKLNLADSSSSADEEQTDQEGEDQELMENRSKSFNFRQIFRNRSKTKDSNSYEKYPKAREEARIEKIEEL